MDNSVQLLAPLVATVACATAARRAGDRLRVTWALLGAASLLWATGHGAWNYSELVLGRATPSPGVADVGFLAADVLAACALLLLVGAPTGVTSRLRCVLDALMVTTALLAVSWTTAGQAAASAGDGGLMAQAVALAYACGDVMTLSLIVTLLARTPIGRRIPLVLFGRACRC